MEAKKIFVVQEIRSFDAETLHCLIQMVRDFGHKLEKITGLAVLISSEVNIHEKNKKISESDRWTNRKPRFKYVCPGYRKKTCNSKAVDGVLLGEFIVQQLSDMSDENSERFKEIFEIKIEEVLEQSSTIQEYTLLKKKHKKLFDK